MKILFDECVPRLLRRELPGHEVTTVRQAARSGTSNGELLRWAEEWYDVFLTVDRNLEYQQDLTGFQIAVIVLVARSNQYADLQPMMPLAMETLKTIRPGELVRIGLTISNDDS